MAYSELIKNFDRIRDYMRQFYVYGFKSRTEYDKKSARSYDNERRRVESWLGNFMRFRQTPDGKNVFLSMDSRSIPANPLYNAFKAKSFTAGDVTFHLYILDLLCGGESYTAQEILNLFCGKYLCRFESDWQPGSVGAADCHRREKGGSDHSYQPAQNRQSGCPHSLPPENLHQHPGRQAVFIMLSLPLPENDVLPAGLYSKGRVWG